MFKRMSVLCRRSSDSREAFARGWLVHGSLVAQLRNIRGYLQNQVVEEIAPGTLGADGFVELWFDTPAAMADAFAGPGTREMAADEPNFLGHATGYALRAASPLRVCAPGAKLICAATDPSDLEPVLSLADTTPGVEMLVDDVAEIIPKAGMTAPPQPVGRFVHLLLPDAGTARAFGMAARVAAPGGVSIHRIQTVQQV